MAISSNVKSEKAPIIAYIKEEKFGPCKIFSCNHMILTLVLRTLEINIE